MELTRQEFEDLRQYIHKLCGLYIQEEKQYLILQRLEGLVQASGCASYGEFHRMLTQAPRPGMSEQIVAAITTNETSFFRDAHPFQTFKSHILPALAEGLKRQRDTAAANVKPRVHIWSAAASTGQEAYSLAMLVYEFLAYYRFFGITEEDFSILATDISSDVLARAAAGTYNEVEISRGLSATQRDKYFTQQGKTWAIREDIRKMVLFRKMNLASQIGMTPSFDVIFCRNVLIYFDDQTKKRIVDQLFTKLKPNGYLVLGSAENLYTMTEKFASVLVGETILYQRMA